MLAAALCLAATPALAQDYDCDRAAAVVMQAVEARSAGTAEAEAARLLTAELGDAVGAELAAWVYALPPELLTEEVGRAWKSQCEAL
jgi:hypothetical protein